MVMKRSNPTNSPETKAVSVLYSLSFSRSLSLCLSVFLSTEQILFLEFALSQIKALNQNLSKSRMLRAMSFTLNSTQTHTKKKNLSVTTCLHQT